MTNPFERQERVALVDQIMTNLRPMHPMVRKTLMTDVFGEGEPGVIPDDEEGYIGLLLGLSTEQLKEVSVEAQQVTAVKYTFASSALTEEARSEYLEKVRSLRDEIKADRDLRESDRAHILKLLQQLEVALSFAATQGADAVETAARAVVGDVAMNRGLWGRLSEKKGWVKDVIVTVGAILTVLDQTGGAYSGVKQITEDVLSHRPAIVSAQPQSDAPVIVDGETVQGEAESPAGD